MVSSRKAVGAVIALAGLFLLADGLVEFGTGQNLGISPSAAAGTTSLMPQSKGAYLTVGQLIFIVVGAGLAAAGIHVARKG